MPKFYEVTAMTDNVNNDRSKLCVIRIFFLANSKFSNSSTKMSLIWCSSLILAYKYDTHTRSAHSEESAKTQHKNELNRSLQLDIGSLEVTVQKHCAIKTQSRVAVKLVAMKLVCTLIVIIRVICRKCKNTILEV